MQNNTSQLNDNKTDWKINTTKNWLRQVKQYTKRKTERLCEKERNPNRYPRSLYILYANKLMKDKPYSGNASFLFIDFKQAFDSIDHQILQEKI